jgi:hypothetical protein
MACPHCHEPIGKPLARLILPRVRRSTSVSRGWRGTLVKFPSYAIVRTVEWSALPIGASPMPRLYSGDFLGRRQAAPWWPHLSRRVCRRGLHSASRIGIWRSIPAPQASTPADFGLRDEPHGGTDGSPRPFDASASHRSGLVWPDGCLRREPSTHRTF